VGDLAAFVCSNDHRGALKILDNILNVGKSGEEGADRPHPHSGGLLERMGWGYEKSYGGRLHRGVSAVV
jgi:hypothetical protein